MYARLACATGWTWEYIDDLVTLPRLLGFADYWRETPPVNESVAAIFKSKDSSSSAQPPQELLSMFPPR